MKKMTRRLAFAPFRISVEMSKVFVAPTNRIHRIVSGITPVAVPRTRTTGVIPISKSIQLFIGESTSELADAAEQATEECNKFIHFMERERGFTVHSMSSSFRWHGETAAVIVTLVFDLPSDDDDHSPKIVLLKEVAK